MKSLLALILFLLPALCLAEDSKSRCFSPDWKVINKEVKFGEVVAYVVPNSYQITVTNVACLLGIEFLKRVNQVPNKLVVGIVKEDFSSGYLVQWNLEDDYFLLIESTEGKGVFTKYPGPLDRIKEIMTDQPFPKPSELPATVQKRFQRNYTTVNLESLLK